MALVVEKVLTENFKELKIVAREFSDCVDVFKTFYSHSGYWMAQLVTDSLNEWSVDKWIDRSSWKFLLQKEHLKPIGEYGSEGLRLKMSLETVFPEESLSKWSSILSHLESKAQNIEGQMSKILSGLSKAVRQFGNKNDFIEIEEEIKKFEDNLMECPILSSYLNSNGESNSSELEFTKLRGIQSSLHEINNRNQIKLKLVRSLKSQLVGKT